MTRPGIACVAHPGGLTTITTITLTDDEMLALLDELDIRIDDYDSALGGEQDADEIDRYERRMRALESVRDKITAPQEG